jgi:hypothetical protein
MLCNAFVAPPVSEQWVILFKTAKNRLLYVDSVRRNITNQGDIVIDGILKRLEPCDRVGDRHNTIVELRAADAAVYPVVLRDENINSIERQGMKQSDIDPVVVVSRGSVSFFEHFPRREWDRCEARIFLHARRRDQAADGISIAIEIVVHRWMDMQCHITRLTPASKLGSDRVGTPGILERNQNIRIDQRPSLAHAQ